MKHKFLGIIAVVAVVAIAGYNVFASQRNVEFSDLVLSNVEALATSEWGYNDCRMDREYWICASWAVGVGCYCGL